MKKLFLLFLIASIAFAKTTIQKEWFFHTVESFGEKKEEKILLEKKYFDEDNNVLKGKQHGYVDSDGYYSKKNYSYDFTNKKSEITKDSLGRIIKKDDKKYEYDNNGRLKKEIGNYSVTIFKYDPNGKIDKAISEGCYDHDGNERFFINYFYSKNGDTLKIIKKDNDNIETIRYYKNNKEYQADHYMGAGGTKSIIDYRINYKYDKNGNCIETYMYRTQKALNFRRSMGDLKSSNHDKDVFIYNDKNQLIERQSLEIDPKTKKIVKKLRWVYTYEVIE